MGDQRAAGGVRCCRRYGITGSLSESDISSRLIKMVARELEKEREMVVGEPAQFKREMVMGPPK